MQLPRTPTLCTYPVHSPGLSRCTYPVQALLESAPSAEPFARCMGALELGPLLGTRAGVIWKLAQVAPTPTLSSNLTLTLTLALSPAPTPTLALTLAPAPTPTPSPTEP